MDILQLGRLLVGANLTGDIGDMKSRGEVIDVAVLECCHHGVLANAVYLEVQLCHDIHVAGIEEASLGFSRPLVGQVVVGNQTKAVNSDLERRWDGGKR